MSWLIKIKYVLVLCLKSNFSWLAGGVGHFFSLNTHYYSLFIGCEISPTFGFLKNVMTVNRLCEDKYFFAFYTPPLPLLPPLSIPVLTTPMRSPRPYSPMSSFFPSSFRITERSRPLSTMKVLSDFSPCLINIQTTSIHNKYENTFDFGSDRNVFKSLT